MFFCHYPKKSRQKTGKKLSSKGIQICYMSVRRFYDVKKIPIMRSVVFFEL